MRFELLSIQTGTQQVVYKKRNAKEQSSFP